MMYWIRQLLSFLIGQYTAKLVRKKALLAYLRILQIVRKSLLAAFFAYFILQMMVFGFLGSVIAGIWLLPYELETKLYLLLGTFGFLFLLPAMGLMFVFSERLWFEASGAKQMMDE
jgi:hypothetical protein